MKQILVFATILTVGLFQATFSLSEKEQKLVSANNDFALRLLKTLQSDQNENVLFSPYSLSAALGMTYAGARGTTQQEMSQALGYRQAGLNDAEIQEAFAHQNNRLQAEAASVGLEVANSAAIQEDFQILDPYYATLNHSFNAHLFKLDFSRNGREAVDTINDWVKQATHEKIEKLFDDPLDSSTKLVLVNAIVFKGLWANQFRREHTEKGFFYNGRQLRSEVDMMFQRVRTNNVFDESLRAHVVELLYRGDVFTMVIVLPSEISGMEALKQDITIQKLDAVTASLRNTTIRLKLPKFKLEKQNNLKSNLATLGLREIFGNADLSGVTGERDLEVSDVVQRVVITVDEEGTEAAAATGVTVIRTGIEPPAVNVDHPFLFFIRNRITREIFFAGQVNAL
ncbi:iripin-2-like isoform X2 [Haemaphysalis longicornis]